MRRNLGRLFAALTAGHKGRDPIFIRDDGKTWGPSHQQRPLDAASTRAKIDPAATHILRHTYASALAMRGVPMGSSQRNSATATPA
jgi:site-specific recombinase XerD